MRMCLDDGRRVVVVLCCLRVAGEGIFTWR